MLVVKDLNAYYGKSHILQGVNLNVKKGEIVSLLGRNGVGRSTTCKAIMGDVAPQGSIMFNGQEIAGLKTHEIAHLGLGYVPENRDIFPTLSVRQNLMLGMKESRKEGVWKIDDLFERFPNLKSRAENDAGVLSGGEQQMLTMARGLGTEPKLMLVDEPTEGLMPAYVETIHNVLVEIQKKGIALLLVEQNFRMALTISKRAYLIEKGIIRWEGASGDLLEDKETRMRYLGV